MTKLKKIFYLFIFLFLLVCVGASSTGVFGTGVTIALDPRTLGTQIDDSVMDKTLDARLLTLNKNYILSVKTKIIDGRIFITGKVNTPEEKLKITKVAWETKGARSVKNDIKIKEKFNFKQSAKDLLITSQLRSALIFNKKIKAVNYNIDTYKKIIYVYGISQTSEEKDEVISEAKQILDVEDVIVSILLVEDLRIQKNKTNILSNIWLIKKISIKKPIKKTQYINVIALFFFLLNKTKFLSSNIEISLFPITG